MRNKTLKQINPCPYCANDKDCWKLIERQKEVIKKLKQTIEKIRETCTDKRCGDGFVTCGECTMRMEAANLAEETLNGK